MSKLAVKLRWLYDGEELLERKVLLIEDEKVKDIISWDSPLPEEYQIVCKEHHFGFPAFVNTHTHSAMTGMRGIADDLPLMEWLENYIFPVELKLVDEEFIDTFFPLALVEMIHSGIGTFADMYFFQHIAAKWVEKAGIRGILAEGVIDFGTPNKKEVKDQLEYVEWFIDEWKGSRYVYPAIGPHAPYTCSPELLKKAFEISQSKDVLYLIHVAETQTEFNIIQERYHTTPVKHLDNLGVLSSKTVAAHSVYLTDEDIEIYKERGVGISHNPQSNLKLASGIAPISKYLKKGLKVSVGTDGVASNNNLDYIEELRTASFLQKVLTNDPTTLSAEKTLEIGTYGGAKVLGFENLGKLKPGWIADIAIVDMDAPHLTPVYNPISHLIYAANASDVDTLIVMGKLIMESREILTLDEEKIIAGARRFSERIKNLIGEQ